MDTITKDESALAVDSADRVVDKRRQMYVKRQFQQSMILEVMLFTFILINVIVTVAYWMMDAIVDIQALKMYLAYTIAGFEVIGFIGIYHYNLKASHRIAGPIFNAERCLQKLEAGDLSGEMRLRSTDQFPELAEQINSTTASVRQRIANAQALATSLQRDNNPETLAALIEELEHFDTTAPRSEAQ